VNRILLSAKALEIGYSGGPLLAPFSLSLEPGQLWCVLGRNGAGKTTLIRTLLALLPSLGGTCTRAKALRLGYLPQKARLDELYPMSVRDLVLMGADRGWSFIKRRSRDAIRRADAAIADLELEALADVRYRDLSEGQKQRVLMARLVTSGPELAFLDEPTTAMDQLAEARAYGTLVRERDVHQTTVVVVTHDFSLARRYADHALFIDDAQRKVVVGSVDDVLASEAFRQRYALAVGGARET
jgi:zinc transport system ATP-binding protein